MSRFSFEESENYGAVKNNYFSLKDDGDTAKIRFLLNNINDLQGVAVHEVQVGDKKIDVECLRSYNELINNCPLCAANYKQNAKLFIPIYDEGSKESKIWTRGRTFFNKISSLCSRYSPLVATPFEVERVGKKGDTNTTYETYPLQSDNAKIEDFPEIKAEGTCFKVKTYKELEDYLKTGMFSDENQSRSNNTRFEEFATRQPARREMPVNQPIRRRPTYNEEDNF